MSIINFINQSFSTSTSRQASGGAPSGQNVAGQPTEAGEAAVGGAMLGGLLQQPAGAATSGLMNLLAEGLDALPELEIDLKAGEWSKHSPLNGKDASNARTIKFVMPATDIFGVPIVSTKSANAKTAATVRRESTNFPATVACAEAASTATSTTTSAEVKANDFPWSLRDLYESSL